MGRVIVRRGKWQGYVIETQPATLPDGSTTPAAWVWWETVDGQPLPDALRQRTGSFFPLAELEWIG